MPIPTVLPSGSVHCPGCMYQGRECRLVIHYEQGFSVLAELQQDSGEDQVDQGPPGDSSRTPPLLSYPFEKLKMSSDDGVRMLFLDFGGKEGEIVSVGRSNEYLRGS